MQMPDIVNFLKTIPELKLDEAKRKALLIYGLSALFIFSAHFYIFLKPSMAKIGELIPEIRARKQEIKSIEDALRYGAKLEDRLKILRKKLVGYEKALSREKELPMLLESLSGMAEKSDVKILTITPRDTGRRRQKGTEEKSVYQEIPIGITAQSGYHQLGSFINRLENGQRYMQVSNIKVNPGEPDSGRHKVEFVVCAYTFQQ